MFRHTTATHSVQDSKINHINSLSTMAPVCIKCVFAENAPALGCHVIISNSSFLIGSTVHRNTNSTTAFDCIAIFQTIPHNRSQYFDVAVYDFDNNSLLDLTEPAVVLQGGVTFMAALQDTTSVHVSSILPTGD